MATLNFKEQGNGMLPCSQEIQKYLLNGTNDSHISDSQISDSGNVVEIRSTGQWAGLVRKENDEF